MTKSDLNIIRQKKEQSFAWKNYKPMLDAVNKIKTININNLNIKIDDYISFGKKTDLNEIEKDIIQKAKKALIPWRKGPFCVFEENLETEWRSDKKYNLIKSHFDIKDKIVADVGCNNGYYMFRMLECNAKRIIGFEPAPLSKLQFDFINHFIKSNIKFEMLGVEHIEFYEHKFDFIFMLGVLYHRPNPIGTLKSINRALNKNGEILIDTFMIDGNDEVSLTPYERYSKIPNIYFIPTIPTLKNWLNRAGFKNIEVIATTTTDSKEQRATKWTFSQSLDDYLDPQDKTKTIEGYPAPKRLYVKAYK
jgi:tRNA (mo5U34)-methyltransferase